MSRHGGKSTAAFIQLGHIGPRAHQDERFKVVGQLDVGRKLMERYVEP